MSTLNMTRNRFYLTLVRHGQTYFNQQQILQGQVDTELNEHGIRQATKLGEYFNKNNIKFDHIYSSDLARAYQTAKLVYGNQEPLTDKLLRERAFGVFEGQTIKVFRQSKSNLKPDELRYFTPEGGETLDQVYQRVKSFCNKLVTVVKNDEKILLVSHGSIIREFMRYFRDELKCNFEGKQIMIITPNTAINTFTVYCETNKMVQVECIKIHDVPHLDEEISKEDINHTSNNNEQIELNAH